jgi:lauroyl/myristoyl acyltransferase
LTSGCKQVFENNNPKAQQYVTFLVCYGKIGLMKLQSTLNSRRVGEIGLSLCRALSPRAGYALADFIAARMASRRNSALVRAIRANQWVAQGECLSAEELDRSVSEVLRHTTRAFYLFFHYLDDSSWLRNFVFLDAELVKLNAASQLHQRGQILLGVHMCYFDIAMVGLVHHGLKATALSLPQATQMVEWQHELRRRSGLEIIPASMHNLRLVIERLRAGGTVATGVDRPMGEVKCNPEFFGHPSHAPVHYVQLALKTQVPVRMLVPVLKEDGCVHFLISQEIEMRRFSDRQEELLYNTQQVLKVAAEFISRYPRQWGMSWPVWPDIFGQVP